MPLPGPGPEELTSQAQRLLADAAVDAARWMALDRRSPARAFSAALLDALGRLAPVARPKADLVRLDDRLELRWPRATVAIHVVAGHDEITLSALAWLAARGAQRVADRHADGVLLISAAPGVLWLPGRRATGLLLGGAWETADLRERFHRHHRAWPRDPAPPPWVPAGVRTTPVLRTPAADGWQVAAATVAPASCEPFAWPPLTAAPGARAA